MTKPIYAGKRREITLDSFIGDDAWVRARLRNPNEYCFIRIVSADEDTYTFNAVNISRVSRDGVCRCSQSFMDCSLKHTETKKKWEVSLIPPLEIFSSEELFQVVDN